MDALDPLLVLVWIFRLSIVLGLGSMVGMTTVDILAHMVEMQAVVTMYVIAAVILELNRIIQMWSCLTLLQLLRAGVTTTPAPTGTGLSSLFGVIPLPVVAPHERPSVQYSITKNASVVLMISVVLVLVYGAIVGYCHMRNYGPDVCVASFWLACANLLHIGVTHPFLHRSEKAAQSICCGLESFEFSTSSTVRQSEPTCPICLADFEVGEKLERLGCGHAFHPGCIRPWLSHKHEREAPCPMRCSMARPDLRAAEPIPGLEEALEVEARLEAEGYSTIVRPFANREPRPPVGGPGLIVADVEQPQHGQSEQILLPGMVAATEARQHSPGTRPELMV